jgi:hypothetical protein
LGLGRQGFRKRRKIDVSDCVGVVWRQIRWFVSGRFMCLAGNAGGRREGFAMAFVGGIHARAEIAQVLQNAIRKARIFEFDLFDPVPDCGQSLSNFVQMLVDSFGTACRFDP